jgi:DNA polymerase
LAKFPVSQTVWDEYHQSEEINDTGVRLDMELVAEAIEMDTQSRQKLTTSMKHMTALENPNSVQQMKQWLADNGMETDSLDKKAVNELLKKAPPELADVLLLRQQLAKSSVRKYQAMENTVSRMAVPVHVSIYGANRTGRFSGRNISCKISRKTIYRIWPKLVGWSAVVTLLPWNCSTKMCRTPSRS